ncbi:hypothetical protein [Candidatus Mycoplasma haematominutum]|uniref:Uncharacterized protein n=1 Tax=Candidatus Mycoplasma haematominutum 'Birmingham 1' TaxID=1116213 RepID=G8C2S5_9MOLU|nr:hypothetical protein [Candidatus Mycoplasma haematominutum]CCE66623.1 hypothetical protein MHM_01050 [Candidatus Mycoplasma haematominutum 'Birmingham 1']
MTITPKVRLGLVLSAGGVSAAGATTMFYARENTSSEQKPELQLTPTSLDNELVTAVTMSDEILEGRPTAQETTQQLHKAFETLWTQIEKEYKTAQQDTERKEIGLNWKSELKNILTEKTTDLFTDYKINENKWKNCSTIGGQDAYCGYLDIEGGSTKYRLKIDKYGKGQPQDWDVTVIRANGSKIEWYLENERGWKNASKQDLEMYQGEQRARDNWWSTFSGKSITIWKSRR